MCVWSSLNCFPIEMVSSNENTHTEREREPVYRDVPCHYSNDKPSGERLLERLWRVKLVGASHWHKTHQVKRRKRDSIWVSTWVLNWYTWIKKAFIQNKSSLNLRQESFCQHWTETESRNLFHHLEQANYNTLCCECCCLVGCHHQKADVFWVPAHRLSSMITTDEFHK